MTTFKTASEITLAVIAAIIIVGCYTCYTWLQDFSDELVAVSLLEFNEPVSATESIVKMIEVVPAMTEPTVKMPRTANKAIAKSIVSITVKDTGIDYTAMTIRELKSLCKGSKIKGWSKLCKADLIVALGGA